MLKFFYTILTSPLGLPIDPIWEYIILLVVGEVVHEIAYWVSPGGKFGSLIYWLTKLIVFVAIWAVLYGIIAAIKFVIIHWIWFTVVGILLLIVATIWITVHKAKLKRNTTQTTN